MDRSQIWEILNKQRINNHENCDLLLKVNKKLFPVHKCIIKSFIPFLDKLLTYKTLESDIGIITVNNVSESIMQIILDFIYTGEK